MSEYIFSSPKQLKACVLGLLSGPGAGGPHMPHPQ